MSSPLIKAVVVCPVCSWSWEFTLRLVAQALVSDDADTRLSVTVHTDDEIPEHNCTAIKEALSPVSDLSGLPVDSP